MRPPNEAAPLKRITASFGVVALSPAPGQTPEGLVEAADRALYRAKAEGKNRVCAGGVRTPDAPTTGAGSPPSRR